MDPCGQGLDSMPSTLDMDADMSDLFGGQEGHLQQPQSGASGRPQQPFGGCGAAAGTAPRQDGCCAGGGPQAQAPMRSSFEAAAVAGGAAASRPRSQERYPQVRAGQSGERPRHHNEPDASAYGLLHGKATHGVPPDMPPLPCPAPPPPRLQLPAWPPGPGPLGLYMPAVPAPPAHVHMAPYHHLPALPPHHQPYPFVGPPPAPYYGMGPLPLAGAPSYPPYEPRPNPIMRGALSAGTTWIAGPPPAHFAPAVPIRMIPVRQGGPSMGGA